MRRDESDPYVSFGRQTDLPATTRFSNFQFPRQCIPSRRHRQDKAPLPLNATPAGVPVAIASPGSHALTHDQRSIIAGMSWIMVCRRRASCRRRPLTFNCSLRFIGFGSSSLVTIHGPSAMVYRGSCRANGCRIRLLGQLDIALADVVLDCISPRCTLWLYARSFGMWRPQRR